MSRPCPDRAFPDREVALPDSAVESLARTEAVPDEGDALPLLSVVLPAYNEEALLEQNVTSIIDYLESLESEFRWEVIIVNDGSRDATSKIADRLAATHPDVITVHHPRNFGLGQAMSYGFANTAGDYVITLDMDLSYDVEHIGQLARTIRDGGARMVLASPYMEGGNIRNELAAGGHDRREAILQEAYKWVGHPDTNTTAVLNQAPWNVPVGAP